MAGGDWTRQELAAAVEAHRSVRTGRETLKHAVDRLVAALPGKRSANSVRRRLTHVRMVDEALAEGLGVEAVADQTHVGLNVASLLAECLRSTKAR